MARKNHKKKGDRTAHGYSVTLRPNGSLRKIAEKRTVQKRRKTGELGKEKEN